MTADHAGQTGGERERDWDLAFRFGLAYFGGRLDRGLLNRTDISDMLTNAYRLGREHAPVPVAGQAAREAAVEAVARELGRHQGLRGPMDAARPDVWQNRCECGWDDGDEHPGWRERYRLHVAAATLSLPEVAALSAARIVDREPYLIDDAPALSEGSVSATDALSAAGGQVCGRYEPEPDSPGDRAGGVHSAAGGQET